MNYSCRERHTDYDLRDSISKLNLPKPCTDYLKRSFGRRGGLMVSALDFGASGPDLSPGRGHCVVFLGKTLYSHSASLHPGV